MKIALIGLLTFTTLSAFANVDNANNCQIVLTGVTSSKQINKLVDYGYEIVEQSEGASYKMHTIHELVSTHLERANQYNTAPIFTEVRVYRTKVFIYKNGQLIRSADSLQGTAEDRDLVGKVQRKIVKEIGKCKG